MLGCAAQRTCRRVVPSKGMPGEQGVFPSDSDMLRALREVGLSEVTGEDLGVVLRWDKVLSVGEQQRLSVARLLVHKPKYAILDEATSANDPENERLMYGLIARTCEAFVSVGHRKSLDEFHAKRLRLLGVRQAGAWRLEPIAPI